MSILLIMLMTNFLKAAQVSNTFLTIETPDSKISDEDRAIGFWQNFLKKVEVIGIGEFGLDAGKFSDLKNRGFGSALDICQLFNFTKNSINLLDAEDLQEFFYFSKGFYRLLMGNDYKKYNLDLISDKHIIESMIAKLGIDFQIKGGASLFYLAVCKKNYELANFLADRGANKMLTPKERIQEDRDALLWFIKDGEENEESLKLLSKFSKQEINKHYVRMLDFKNGFTPLHLATRQNKVGFIRKLIEIGADAHANDDDGNSCFFYSMYHNGDRHVNSGIFKLLLGSLDAECEFSKTLIQAVKQKNPEFLRLLLEKVKNKKVAVNNKDAFGCTPLFGALESSSNIQTLIDNGADLNHSSYNGDNVLHVFFKGFTNKLRGGSIYNKDFLQDDLVVLNQLIVNGVDLKKTNNDGKTPLDMFWEAIAGVDDFKHISTEKKLDKFIQFCLEQIADLQKNDNYKDIFQLYDLNCVLIAKERKLEILAIANANANEISYSDLNFIIKKYQEELSFLEKEKDRRSEFMEDVFCLENIKCLKKKIDNLENAKKYSQNTKDLLGVQVYIEEEIVVLAKEAATLEEDYKKAKDIQKKIEFFGKMEKFAQLLKNRD